MVLFDVPGWGMPTDIQPSSDGNSRKRKRPGAADEDASFKIQTAGVNLEKLMRKLDEEEAPKAKDKPKGKHEDRAPQKKSKRKAVGGVDSGRREPDEPSEEAHTSTSKRKREIPKKAVKSLPESSTSRKEPSPTASSKQTQQPAGKKGKKQDNRKDNAASETSADYSKRNADSHLTNLQSKMKQSLDGARFRWINETLYKSDSKDAERLMHEDPQVFEEYHVGFRHQVTSWPSNPVEHYIESLSSYPERSVVVDLGCGDATLAQNLVPKGYNVLSYDLISANPFIIATDICGKLPVPGSEEEDEGQIVDVVVCSLSLMSTNWLNCIREARRILKKGGELKIAEVASRFTSVDKFTSVVCSIGFRLVSKDERNSHFTLLEFQKTEGPKNFDEKTWQKVLKRGDVLQPCEYKRR